MLNSCGVNSSAKYLKRRPGKRIIHLVGTTAAGHSIRQISLQVWVHHWPPQYLPQPEHRDRVLAVAVEAPQAVVEAVAADGKQLPD